MADRDGGTSLHAADDAYCADAVRTGDRDRYLANLFAPPAARAHLNALAAFAIDLSSIRSRVSEAMLGELRLQWWRDALDTVQRGGATGNPVADALGRAMAAGSIAREPVEAMIDARTADLHDEPMASLDRLESYLADAEATVFGLGARILDAAGAPAEIIRHAGIARGLVVILGELRARPWRACFLPRDLMAVHGAEEGEGPDDPATAAVVADLLATARHHLERARDGFSGLGPAARPAFLPLAGIALDLDRLERGRPVGGALIRRQLAIYLAARRGRL